MQRATTNSAFVDGVERIGSSVNKNRFGCKENNVERVSRVSLKIFDSPTKLIGSKVGCIVLELKTMFFGTRTFFEGEFSLVT